MQIAESVEYHWNMLASWNGGIIQSPVYPLFTKIYNFDFGPKGREIQASKNSWAIIRPRSLDYRWDVMG
jgi:hypothetical protein